jgi:tetratricopeptide (TPR) repeat protein/RsiW-degrading membrane proteinase PrsW (M82 family)
MNLLLNSRILALPAALIGGVLVALLILRLGRRRFSPRLLGMAIACGAMVAFLPAAIDIVTARLHLPLAPFWDAVFKAFVLAGIGEEGAKLIVAYFLVRPYFERRTARDLVLGVASVALGFALLENVLYVFAAADRWQATALTRMATAVPFHALVGLVLGAGLARADVAAGGARRVVLIARAWLIAALLHGFYDFPLFLGERAPLYPTQINQFAFAFSATTPTALSVLYLAAVIAACLAATRVIVGLRADTAVASTFFIRPLWPKWLDRLVFAPAAGLVLSALLLLPSAIWVGLAIDASLAGIMPLMMLNALSVCAASTMLGILFLLRAAPPDADKPRVSGRRRALAFGALGLAVLAIAVFAAPINAARRNLLAYALVISGNSYGGQSDLERAVANYDSALQYKPDFVPALFQRALASKTYQRYDRELDDLNAAVRLAPDDPAILGERAGAYENLHQMDKALADLDRALTIKPDEAALLSMRAEMLINDGEFDKAAVDLDRAIALEPDLGLARAARGDLFLQKFDYDKALSELDEAVRIDPNFATSYFTRGRVRFFRGEFAAAISDFQQANARQRDAYSTLWLYLARGRIGQNGHDELVFWAGALPRNAWPFPLIEFYLGARPAPLVYSLAANPDQICEADFYIGEWLVQQNLEQPAIEKLRRAIAACPKSFIEYGGAVAELKRLAPPAPPRSIFPDAPPPAVTQEPAQPPSAAPPANAADAKP